MSSVHPSPLIQPQSVQSHLLHSRLPGCEHQPWPYTWGGWLPTNHKSWEEASPQTFLLWSAGQFLVGVTCVKELFSFSDWRGNSLSSFSFPIFIPKDPTPPGFSGALPVCPPTVRRFPGALPSTLTECSSTWCHSVYRQRCRAASKKIGSSADSKIKSSQSMKSALITLHT